MKSIRLHPYILLLLFFCQICNESFSQKTELLVNANSGLFFYRGGGAASASAMSYGIYAVPAITQNIYGKQSGFSWAAELQLQHINRKHFMFGTALGYERLTSSVKVNNVVFSSEYIRLYSSSGSTKLSTDYITLRPFAGKRFNINKLTFDLLCRIDLDFTLSSHERGKAFVAETNSSYTTDNEWSKPTVDVRPGIEIKAGYRKTGLLLGYSMGLTNYRLGLSTKAYSNFLRMGISYRIK